MLSTWDVYRLKKWRNCLYGYVGDCRCDFDITGRVSETGMKNRVVGLRVEDLQNIPNVIAVASENNKCLSILGALRTKAVDILAITENIAQILLTVDAENPGS